MKFLMNWLRSDHTYLILLKCTIYSVEALSHGPLHFVYLCTGRLTSTKLHPSPYPTKFPFPYHSDFPPFMSSPEPAAGTLTGRLGFTCVFSCRICSSSVIHQHMNSSSSLHATHAAQSSSSAWCTHSSPWMYGEKRGWRCRRSQGLGRGEDDEKADGTAAHGFPAPSLRRK